MKFSLDEKVKTCYKAVLDKKGDNVVILNLTEMTSFTDYFLICSGSSSKQVQSIVDEIVHRLKVVGIKEMNVEGYQAGRWVLVDCMDIVVHVFHEEARSFYDIERLWGEAPIIKLAINC